MCFTPHYDACTYVPLELVMHDTETVKDDFLEMKQGELKYRHYTHL